MAAAHPAVTLRRTDVRSLGAGGRRIERLGAQLMAMQESEMPAGKPPSAPDGVGRHQPSRSSVLAIRPQSAELGRLRTHGIPEWLPGS
jgi:hypothetical protein